MSSLTVDRGVTVTMPDGIRLAADVYRPAGPGRHPVVLLRTPYDRGHAAAFGLQLNAVALASAGYVAVIGDVRGRFGSEGEFDPFTGEAVDGVRTIEWAAEQPWSNGVVAMAGMSYCGYVQVLAARERPDALRAWIPAFCPVDVREDWIYDGDAFRLAFDLSLMVGTLAPMDARIADPTPFRAAFTDWDRTLQRPPDGHPELAGTALGRHYRDWLERADDAGWWADRSGRGAGAHDAPVLVIGGWYDLFGHGTFALHEELQQGPAAASLLVGPWDHSPLPLRSGSGDLDFGPAAAVDLPGTQLRWLDHVLRDGPSPLADAVRVFVTGLDRWLDLPAWPPEHRVETWHPSPDGRLAESAPSHATTCGFAVDAADPTPTVGGRLFARPTTFRAGPLDQSRRQARPDVLAFDGPRVDRELLLAGPVRATIVSGSSSPTADIVLTLSDVRPDGRVLPIADGVRRRHGLGIDPAAFEVDLGHVAHALRPGHRLRLDIAGASFPAIDRQPPTGTARRTVVLGGATPSHLRLPVVTGGDGPPHHPNGAGTG